MFDAVLYSIIIHNTYFTYIKVPYPDIRSGIIIIIIFIIIIPLASPVYLIVGSHHSG